MIKILLYKFFTSLVFKVDFQKAYYVLELKHLIMYVVNKIRKKNSIPNSFWTGQSSVSIKEDISRYKKSNEKEQNIDFYPTNSEEI